jgi:hypothetical protein
LSNLKRPPEHPFWVAGKGWVAAKELAKGDRLITPDEKVAVVGEVRVEAVRGPPVAVYNLEVEGTHTYFVGKSGVWVHNACRLHDHHPMPVHMGGHPRQPTVPGIPLDEIHNAIADATGIPRNTPQAVLKEVYDGARPDDLIEALRNLYNSEPWKSLYPKLSEIFEKSVQFTDEHGWWVPR